MPKTIIDVFYLSDEVKSFFLKKLSSNTTEHLKPVFENDFPINSKLLISILRIYVEEQKLNELADDNYNLYCYDIDFQKRQYGYSPDLYKLIESSVNDKITEKLKDININNFMITDLSSIFKLMKKSSAKITIDTEILDKYYEIIEKKLQILNEGPSKINPNREVKRKIEIRKFLYNGGYSTIAREIDSSNYNLSFFSKINDMQGGIENDRIDMSIKNEKHELNKYNKLSQKQKLDYKIKQNKKAMIGAENTKKNVRDCIKKVKKVIKNIKDNIIGTEDKNKIIFYHDCLDNCNEQLIVIYNEENNLNNTIKDCKINENILIKLKLKKDI